ncbi:MAG: orotidine-5'-phosphate decarboxylase [Patescibacteria group bacterium]
MKFTQKFNNIVNKNNSLLCVGLDTDLEKIPKRILKKKNPIFEFNKEIIDATHDLVCSYKPNIAFYEAYGIDGLGQLKLTMQYLQKKYPEIPTILDAKRADIPNTARMYAKAAFDFWKADAITVFPTLGLDSLLPFLEYRDKLIILLLKTSNPDSPTFQNFSINRKPYYLAMANIIKTWKYENIGIFVGSTYPNELKRVRDIFPDHTFLSAGIGHQNATIAKAVKSGINKQKKGVMFNVSRHVIYSDSPRKEASKFRDNINKYR